MGLAEKLMQSSEWVKKNHGEHVIHVVDLQRLEQHLLYLTAAEEGGWCGILDSSFFELSNDGT